MYHYTLDELECYAETTELPLDKVVKLLRAKEKHDEKVNAARRSSPEEIEAINSNIERIFSDNPHIVTKDLVKEMGLPSKQGNLARVSRKLAQLRLAHSAAA